MASQQPENPSGGVEKGHETTEIRPDHNNMGSKLEEQKPDPEKDDVSIDGPAGVRAIQAATSVWTKWHLMAAYGL